MHRHFCECNLSQNATFCWPLDQVEVADSMRSQLHGKLFRSLADKEPLIELQQLLTDSDFVRQRQWDSLGLPSKDADVNSFVARYVHMLVLETLHKRDKRGLPVTREVDGNCGKVADVLQQDLEWLERAAVVCYIRRHHRAALHALTDSAADH